jgi:Predicted hydrolase (HAD superfamily)
MPKKRPNPMNCDTYDYWIFDLDNTLYDIKLSLFKRVSIRITQFIINYFGITKNEALKLQRELYLKYGLTLRGLIVEKKIEPQDFLKYVHDVEFPELKIDNELKSLLSKLKGKKYVYTNASYQHAKNILKLLGVMEEFEYILDIEATDFIPKPNIESYKI